MTELPVQRLLLDSIAAVESAGLPYMVIGGFAVRTWAIPRPTYDADLVVGGDDRAVEALLARLEAAGFEVPTEHKPGFRDRVGGMEKLKATRFASGSLWEVDLFLARGKYLETALSRRRSRRIEGKSVWVVAPEDLILLKLGANRRKDQLDVEETLALAAELDMAYLRRWAAELGVTDRLEGFLRERPG
ncbi:MAG: DUF6036 family nucleotidyltransferase [Planctomycetales bacterium]|nr:DUF6036 family nucleotidyltransferase [Planctomycetales bacterium]